MSNGVQVVVEIITKIETGRHRGTAGAMLSHPFGYALPHVSRTVTMNDQLAVDVHNGHHGHRSRLRGTAVAMVAIWGLCQPGPAAAAGVTLQYTCTPGGAMTAQVAFRPPTEIAVDKPVPAVTVAATATITTTDTQLIRFAGVASLDGSGTVPGVIVAPQGTIDTPLHLIVSPTQVPTSGAMAFQATGAVTGLSFRQPGQAVVEVGTTLALTLTPRDANGNSIIGPTTVSCTLNPGQHQQLLSFDIKAATPAVIHTKAPKPTPAPATAKSSATSPPTTVSTTARPTPSPTKVTTRDTATTLTDHNSAADWWLPLAGTLAILAGTIGGLQWRHNRRRRRL